MKLQNWYQKRGAQFVVKRCQNLFARYGFSSRKAAARILHHVEALAKEGYAPTLLVPGLVLEQHLPLMLNLNSQGVELAVHGYNHVDFKAYPIHEGVQQLIRAEAVFRKNGLAPQGFRCPYLSSTDALIAALPKGVFSYSSNKAIQWSVNIPNSQNRLNLFQTIESFYTPMTSEKTFCLPWFQDGIVEIPVCVPDDLQLFDGLCYSLDEIAQVWLEILNKTHQRGELFNLMFHPELADHFESPFAASLKAAQAMKPGVWIAQLRDVNAWWREKNAFQVYVTSQADDYTIRFDCSPRATVLCRGLPRTSNMEFWADGYWQLKTDELKICGPKLPFIGLGGDVPEETIAFLRNIGYIVETGEEAVRCALYLEQSYLTQFSSRVTLVEAIEQRPEELVRFWPWPDGKRSALCITGDLDALSLMDYAARLVVF